MKSGVLFLLATSLPTLTVGAFETELLNSYPLQRVPYLLKLYTELQYATELQVSSNSTKLEPETTGAPLPIRPKDPDDAFKILIQALTNSYQELHAGLANPLLNPIPASSKAKLQVAEQWFCPTLSVGFAEYLDETLSERVLYEALTPNEYLDDEELHDDLRFDKRRWDELTLQSARKFYTRVQMELRLFTASETDDVDAAFETLFTKCVVAPLLKDMEKAS